MTTYIVAATGDTDNQQDGSEQHPFIGFQGMQDVQKYVKPGDTVLLRGTFSAGQIRWGVHGTRENRITIDQHPDGAKVDGQYIAPYGAARWRGVDLDGNPTEGVHAPLVRIRGDFTNWMVPVMNSRGRLVQIGGDRNRVTVGSNVTDTIIQGARTAMIDIRDARMCGVYRCHIEDGSNYYPARGGDRILTEQNIAGCIKTIRAENIWIVGNRIKKHYGNVITPSRSSNIIHILENEVSDCNGTAVYVHWATNVRVKKNVSWYSPEWKMGIHSAYVVNNEEEFHHEDVAAGRVLFHKNLALGTSYGLNIWGNEGKDVMVDGLKATENTFINCTKAALRTQRNAQYKNFLLRDNIFAAQSEDELFDLNSPYELDMDESNRSIVGKVSATRAYTAGDIRRLEAYLRVDTDKGVPPVEARKWIAEGKKLMPQLQEWWARRPL